MKQSHFEKAFRRSTSTASKTTLAKIKAFAKDFDPAALEIVAQEDMESRIESSGNQARKNAACIIHNHAANDQTRMQEAAVSTPPNLLDLDLDPLRTCFTPHERPPTTAGREEVGSNIEGAELDNLEDPFQYTPLNPNSKQIRVLSIKPKTGIYNVDDNGPLRCTLKTVDLDDRRAYCREISPYLRRSEDGITLKEGVQRFNWGDYIALSYTWGDSKDRHDIVLNGHHFLVTSNLYQALLNLQDFLEGHHLKLHVWVDAICINQGDLIERAAEVKKMEFIYSECRLVSAWMGNPIPEVATELLSMRRFLDSIRGVDAYDLRWETDVDMDVAHSLRVVFSGLYSEPYWERLWIMQEIALAPRVLFCYGHHVLTAEELRKLNSILSRGLYRRNFGDSKDSTAMDNIRKATSRFNCLQPLSEIASGRPQLNILGLLRLAKSSLATDLRDKVYGLLALLPDAVAKQISPNYETSCSVEDVFTMFSKSLFQAEGNLNFLARIRKQPSQLHGLPSWAFDLKKELDVHVERNEVESHRNHRAGLGMSMTELTFSKDCRLMSCKGAKVDTIDSLGAAQWLGPGMKESSIQNIELGPRSSAPFTTKEWRESLARVLLQDSNFEPSKCLSVLDILWVERDELDKLGRELNLKTFAQGIRYENLTEQDRSWPRLYLNTELCTIFHMLLYGNENFDIGGKPLRSYFTSTDQLCSNLEGFKDISRRMLDAVRGRRLLISRNGLLGLAPYLAMLGDKIVVFSTCDMPLVLRPKGDHFEVIGGCFVEGLMKGEVAKGIESGQFQLETITLC